MELEPEMQLEEPKVLEGLKESEEHNETEEHNDSELEPKEKKRYAQKFRESWLQDKLLSPWLVAVDRTKSDGESETVGKCKFCACIVGSKYCDLVRHVKTQKHQKHIDYWDQDGDLSSYRYSEDSESHDGEANNYETRENSNEMVLLTLNAPKDGSASNKRRVISLDGDSEEYRPTSTRQSKKQSNSKGMVYVKNAYGKEMQISRETIDNEFDAFCLSLAIQLKNMPLHRALMCQAKLQAVMTEERLGLLGYTSESVSFNSQEMVTEVTPPTSSE